MCYLFIPNLCYPSSIYLSSIYIDLSFLPSWFLVFKRENKCVWWHDKPVFSFCYCYLHIFLPPLCSVLYPVNAFFCAAFFSLSLSLPLLFFSEWLLFHVGCPCWKNQSNVVFTLKSHCFHDYKKTYLCLHVYDFQLYLSSRRRQGNDTKRPFTQPLQCEVVASLFCIKRHGEGYAPEPDLELLTVTNQLCCVESEPGL